MTELQLYKWIQEHEPEWRWEGEEVIVWVSVWSLESFLELFDTSDFNDGGGYEARLTGRYIAIVVNEVCDYFGIKIKNVFPQEKQ